MNPFDEEAIDGSGVDESEEDAEIALFASPTNGGGDCIRLLVSSCLGIVFLVALCSKTADAAISFCLVGDETGTGSSDC